MMELPRGGSTQETAKVRRLVTQRDVAGTSKAREEFPAYHDPVIQLAAVALVFVGGLAAELATGGRLETVFQVAVVLSGLLGAAVLLRSVRNGWNVKAYGRARQASRRETTSRVERDALREASKEFATLLHDERGASAIDLLQSLTEDMRVVLDRDIQQHTDDGWQLFDRPAARTSVTVVEQVEGRFFVFCVAGYMRDKPFHVAPGKSCAADEPFPRLLQSFAPHGQVGCEEIRSAERTFWVGVTSKETSVGIDSQMLKTLAAWVALADATGLVPRSVQSLLRTA